VTRQALYLMAKNDTVVIIIIKIILILLLAFVFFLGLVLAGSRKVSCVYLENFSPFPAIPLRPLVIWIGRVTSDFFGISELLFVLRFGGVHGSKASVSNKPRYLCAYILSPTSFILSISQLNGRLSDSWVLPFSHLLSYQDKHF